MKRRNKKSPQIWRRQILPLLLLAVMLAAIRWLPELKLGLFSEDSGGSYSGKEAEASLRVSFLDCGQGNAVLAESGGRAMLIDGGPADFSQQLIRILEDRGIRKLDYAIATHYDADHISGLADVLRAVKTDLILRPDYKADTSVYRNFCRAEDAAGCRSVCPEAGEKYSLGEAEFTVVAPRSYEAEEENDRSIGIRLVCGETSFLMLGDAGFRSEEEMLESGRELSSDVYLASHHGSSHSSSAEFLEEVRPAYTVISAGAGNDFGHPAPSAMRRLEDTGCRLYRTDLQGTVTAVSDGEKITFDQRPCDDFRCGSGMYEN